MKRLLLSGLLSACTLAAQPKPGLSVYLTDRTYDVFGQGAQSDATGKLTFAKPIRPGQISPDDFEIHGPAQIELILSKTAGKISGSVTDADGNPFPLSTVTLLPTDGKSRPMKTSADDKGSFQFANLRPGEYTLYAWEEVDNDLWQDPEFRKKHDGRSMEVTVDPGETQHVQLSIIPAEDMK
ncbi:MAG TPA: carboxypeptidase-like regulatory domain-containing protein [Bryobacteraceae bacterium]|nr:carboxypeptidase-like regulatory domain-containing protein [Bryobacteraceae bacterium]